MFSCFLFWLIWLEAYELLISSNQLWVSLIFLLSFCFLFSDFRVLFMVLLFAFWVLPSDAQENLKPYQRFLANWIGGPKQWPEYEVLPCLGHLGSYLVVLCGLSGTRERTRPWQVPKVWYYFLVLWFTIFIGRSV